MDRRHQPVSLSRAGEQLLEAGLEARARIEQERDQIANAEVAPDGYVARFGAQHAIGWRFYPEWLQTLEEAQGPIRSRLRAVDLPNCLRDLAAGDLDFVIGYERVGTRQDRARPSLEIGRDKLIPVCKPALDGSPAFRFGDGPVPYLRFGAAPPLAKLLAPLFTCHVLAAQLDPTYKIAMVGALRMRARRISNLGCWYQSVERRGSWIFRSRFSAMSNGPRRQPRRYGIQARRARLLVA